jgi:hypothetical protein
VAAPLMPHIALHNGITARNEAVEVRKPRVACECIMMHMSWRWGGDLHRDDRHTSAARAAGGARGISCRWESE